jgi:orotidine-5'-phosphate decarboxylase
MMKEKNSFFVALDYPDKKSALDLVRLLPSDHKYYKVGMELFFSEGPALLFELAQMNKRVFLDLKLYDIPETVKRTLAALSHIPFFMINIHLLGGEEMSQKAREALRENNCPAKLIGVTILTSFDHAGLTKLFPAGSLAEQIEPALLAGHLALRGKEWGLDGVVCAPEEAMLIKKMCGADFLTITPGIRFAADSAQDQKRIVTPEKAGSLGCDFPVIGRPITRKKNANEVIQAYENFVQAFST